MSQGDHTNMAKPKTRIIRATEIVVNRKYHNLLVELESACWYFINKGSSRGLKKMEDVLGRLNKVHVKQSDELM